MVELKNKNRWHIWTLTKKQGKKCTYRCVRCDLKMTSEWPHTPLPQKWCPGANMRLDVPMGMV